MTFFVFTNSHGYVDSGFYGAFMKLSRIGKYAFETKDLCGLAQNLAENPGLKEAKIFGYDENKFWELEEKYNPVFVIKRISSIIDKDEKEIREFARENLKLSIEEKVRLMDDKIEVPVEIKKSEKLVNIGEYEIENSQFLQFIYYILHGGHVGWRETPDFAKSAITAIQHSRNPLYKS